MRAIRGNVIVVLFLLGVMNTGPSQAHALKAAETQTPSPLLSKGHGVDWWFVFKFNAITFPRPSDSKPTCMFGGHPGGQPRAKDFGKSSGKPFKRYTKIGQDFVFASNEQPSLQKGDGYLGDSTDDPLGATFDEVYNGDLYFVIWNDQFYGDPALRCEKGRPYCSGPWAHSKGIIAWDAKGDGFMIQVTTPDWPGSGSADYKRKEGNSLGCTSDNNVSLSQDFFALKLPKKDLLKVLAALEEEGAVTDLDNPQIVKSGGPKDVTDAVAALGKTNPKETFTDEKLSSGIRLISKSGSLYVPPWQMISAVLGGIPLRVASFRSPNPIDTTIQRKTPPCWSKSLSAPGPVQAASSGSWDGESIGFTTGTNHAKIGVSTSSDSRITIFSDMNDAGTLAPDETNNSCAVSQNGRGGMFFVLENKVLRDSVAGLLSGDSAETVRY